MDAKNGDIRKELRKYIVTSVKQRNIYIFGWVEVKFLCIFICNIFNDAF
jgi:hypothetical protein